MARTGGKGGKGGKGRMGKKGSSLFPGETTKYRTARNRLLEKEINLAIVASSPIDRLLTFARERGWRHLRLLSSAVNSYNRDYHGENEAGDQLPMMNVFTRRRGRVYHTWATELFFATPDRGQDNRHVDLIWPVWNLLDMTPEGRGAKWGPKLRY